MHQLSIIIFIECRHMSSYLLRYDFHWLNAMNISCQFDTNGRNTDQIISSMIKKNVNEIEYLFYGAERSVS